MNTERINELLERYYEALTTEREEEELRLFFTKGEVPAHLMAEKELFMQLQAAGAEAVAPEGMEVRLSKAIDSWEDSLVEGQRTMAEAPGQKQHRSRIYRLRWVGGIAASVLLMLALGWQLYEPAPMRRDTCATPEEAYAEAHEALMQFALAIDKGEQQIAMVHSTTAMIEENINEYLTLTIE